MKLVPPVKSVALFVQVYRRFNLHCMVKDVREDGEKKLLMRLKGAPSRGRLRMRGGGLPPFQLK